MGMITIDIDEDKLELADPCVSECMPCEARISPSGKGIHVKKNGDNNELLWKLKEKYDDSTRYIADCFRKKSGLLHNALFDNRCYNGIRKYAGKWYIIETEIDKKRFLEILR
jgi:hypothetical protein